MEMWNFILINLFINYNCIKVAGDISSCLINTCMALPTDPSTAIVLYVNRRAGGHEDTSGLLKKASSSHKFIKESNDKIKVKMFWANKRGQIHRTQLRIKDTELTEHLNKRQTWATHFLHDEIDVNAKDLCRMYLCLDFFGQALVASKWYKGFDS